MVSISLSVGVRYLYHSGTLFVVDERYDCTKQIGHGAYGVVCSGVDTVKNNKVAIKKVFIAL